MTKQVLSWCIMLIVCFASISVVAGPLDIQLMPYGPSRIQREAEDLLSTAPDTAIHKALHSRLVSREYSNDIRIPSLHRDKGKLTFVFEYIERGHYIAESNERVHVLSAFSGSDTEALWIKLLMTISELSGVPISAIMGISRNADCGELQREFVWVSDGVFQRTGNRCWRTVAVDLRVTFDRRTIKAAPAATLPSVTLPFERVSDLAQAFLKQHNVVPIISDHSDRHVVVGAYGLKNVIVRGENLWERVSFYISDISDNRAGPLSLSIVSDGYFTSGLGVAPPITSYTNPLEPKYYKQLEDFGKNLVEYVRKEL